MLSLFDGTKHPSLGTRIDPSWNYLSKQYHRQITLINERHRRMTSYLRNEHILIKLINLIDAPIQYPIDRYVPTVEARIPNVVRLLQLTSSVSAGALHKNQCYSNAWELFISDDRYVNIFSAEKYWDKLLPLKVLSHPYSDLDLTTEGHLDHGLVIIGVSIVLLMIQYRGYQLYHKENGGTKTVASFVKSFLLPSLLYSHLDIALFNRTINLSTGEPYSKTAYKAPVIPIIHYETKVDEVLSSSVKHLRKTPMQFSDMLLNIPSAGFSSMATTMRLPEVARTRQVWWSMVLSRLPVFTGLLSLGGDYAVRRNGDILGTLKRDLRELLASGAYTHLPKSLYTPTISTINELMRAR